MVLAFLNKRAGMRCVIPSAARDLVMPSVARDKAKWHVMPSEVEAQCEVARPLDFARGDEAFVTPTQRAVSPTP